HFGMAGIGENAAVAERPWAELHASAIPCDHSSIRDQLGRVAASFFERTEPIHRDRSAELAQRQFLRLLGMCGAEERYRRTEVVRFSGAGRPIECRAQS